MEKLVLIDGHAILHRAYHAYPALTTTKGELINVVYGFTSILLSVLKNLSPQYVAVAFDLPKPTFRHKEFKAYKAHRPKVDKELKEQIPKAKGVVRALSIPIFEKEGFEADDVIGSLACKAKLPNIKNQKSKIDRIQKQLEIIIVTGDKDALQLIDNHVKVFMPGRGKKPAKMFGRKEFIKGYGFEPRGLVDFKALAGDASDGIPGVKGIGPKTATNLIIKFGDLKGIYKRCLGINLDRKKTILRIQKERKSLKSRCSQKNSAFQSCKESIRKKLLEGMESAILSYKLAEIVLDIPLKFNLLKCKLLDYNQKKVIKLFEVLEFRSLIKRLPGRERNRDREKSILNLENKTEKREDKDKQMGLFK
jgi:DNA polymerase-1